MNDLLKVCVGFAVGGAMSAAIVNVGQQHRLEKIEHRVHELEQDVEGTSTDPVPYTTATTTEGATR